MSYKSRYYIVAKSKSGFECEKGKRWAEKIAEFNMCKFMDFANFFKKETDCFIYSDDGNTPILKDSYDDPLKELPLKEALETIEFLERTKDYYRRVAPFKALLSSIDENFKGEELFVLHYGH